MKKLVALILALSMVFALCACGKSEGAKRTEELITAIGEISLDSKTAIDEALQSYEGLSDKEKEAVENYSILENAIIEYSTIEEKHLKQVEAERLRDLALTELTEEKWINVNDGDAYLLNKDGTGTHEGTNLSFSLEEDLLTVVEGTASVQEKVFVWDKNNDYSRLIPEGENVFYVRESDYEEVGRLVREENIRILLSVEWWKAKGGAISFKENGVGYMLFPDYSNIKMSWTMVDNNTIKASLTYSNRHYSIDADIVNDNGNYRLEDIINGTVWIPG